MCLFFNVNTYTLQPLFPCLSYFQTKWNLNKTYITNPEDKRSWYNTTSNICSTIFPRFTLGRTFQIFNPAVHRHSPSPLRLVSSSIRTCLFLHNPQIPRTSARPILAGSINDISLTIAGLWIQRSRLSLLKVGTGNNGVCRVFIEPFFL